MEVQKQPNLIQRGNDGRGGAAPWPRPWESDGLSAAFTVTFLLEMIEAAFTLTAVPALCFRRQVKKYFELEPLARGKRWILEGSSSDNMEAVKESFSQFISLLEDKDTEPARI